MIVAVKFSEHCCVLTFSCLKKQSIFSSRNTLLQETRFWKTLGIFLRATRFPSLGSVTDLGEEDKNKVTMSFSGSNEEFGIDSKADTISLQQLMNDSETSEPTCGR